MWHRVTREWPIEFELAMVLTACITLYIFAYGSFLTRVLAIIKIK